MQSSLSGDPVMVLCDDGGLSLQQARTVAAVCGAGRDVRVITTQTLPVETAAWIPAGSIHKLGTELPGSPAVATSTGVDTSQLRESYFVDMSSWFSAGDGDSELLASTPITLNWDVAWWGLDGALHLPEDGQDWYFDRYYPISSMGVLFALPFLVGDAAVLGVCSPRAQYFASADSFHVITGNWHRIDSAHAGEQWKQYSAESEGFSTGIVSGLIDRHNPRDPDPLFPNNKGAEDMFTTVIMAMLEGISLGLLSHGSAGFALMKPHLAEFLHRLQLDAVEAMSGIQ